MPSSGRALDPVNPPTPTPPAEAAWSIVRAAARRAESLERSGRPETFAIFDGDLIEIQRLPVLPDTGDIGTLMWSPGSGWVSQLPADDPRAEILNLYLPICSASSQRPLTVGHLGQSLDGFIATHSGDSQFVTGDHNIVHLHRMRALCDAVVVGAGTVAADDPQLTVRHVEGPNPLRVVFDPGRRLAPTFRVFTDAGRTLYVCSRGLVGASESSFGNARLISINEDEPDGGLAEVLRLLRAQGCARIFVEGGGVTVSAFLQANLLDRLQIAIAPVIIGDGRPAIRLAPHARLRDCRRPRYRVFRMGGDVMFDCELNSQADATDAAAPDLPPVNQVI